MISTTQKITLDSQNLLKPEVLQKILTPIMRNTLSALWCSASIKRGPILFSRLIEARMRVRFNSGFYDNEADFLRGRIDYRMWIFMCDRYTSYSYDDTFNLKPDIKKILHAHAYIYTDIDAWLHLGKAIGHIITYCRLALPGILRTRDLITSYWKISDSPRRAWEELSLAYKRTGRVSRFSGPTMH